MEVYSRRTERTNYDKPALQEVVVSLFLSNENRSFPSLPGLCEQKFTDLFAESVTVDSLPQSQHSSDFALPPRPTVQLRTEDKSFYLQHGPGVLSFHALKPYCGFEIVQERVRKVTKFLQEQLAGFEVQDVNLLYFNSFDFTNERVVIGDFFDVGIHIPRVPGLVPSAIRDFQVSSEVEYRELNRSVQITLHSYLNRQVGLRLECWAIDRPAWTSDGLSSWLRSSHDLLGDVFETTITDRTRELLGRSL